MTEPTTEGGAFLLRALQPDVALVAHDDVIYPGRDTDPQDRPADTTGGDFLARAIRGASRRIRVQR